MHKKEIRELICAMLLGDSSIYIGTHPRHTSGTLWTEHSKAQEDYLLWKKDQIDNIFRKKKLNRSCKVYHRSREDSRTGKTYHSSSIALGWKTYLTLLHKRIYKKKGNKNVKKVEYLLKNISSDKHLAIWFMDDVSESKSKARHRDGTQYYKNPYFRLGTYCFTQGECQLIKEWFERKYEVSPSINQYKHGPILQFSVKDSRKLFPHIRPFVLQIPSMHKKFKLCLERY